MNIELLLVTLLSHIIFDFVLQFEFIRNDRFPFCKEDGRDIFRKNILLKTIKGNMIHTFLHLVGLYIILIITQYLKNNPIYISFWMVVIIGLIHFVIDETKSVIYLFRTSSKNNVWIFLLDQVFHIVSISAIIYKFSFANLLNVLKYKLINYPNGFTLTEKLLITVMVFFICTWAVGIFIKIFVNYIIGNKNKLINDDGLGKNIIDENGNIIKIALSEAKNGGFIIGILERILILISIVINYPAMIGFVLTAKSVARLKKLSNDSFAEYFIIGTFISFMSALTGGVIVRSLFLK
ncbi:DUF3307 domain-containing protein [Clostridium manihotivorum]|uniref:DUF3307 domain-containing protein n=1 Tax=Clostridium manihotivorum TaxID=2320868 RepID=A0A410DVK1_9CLOT|nr:DUF3307 domain-containing protein [Clostridium manihotivorum]QAA33095.1 hypothetical protein C1I91_16430 [Clostridium manihotivorum]